MCARTHVYKRGALNAGQETKGDPGEPFCPGTYARGVRVYYYNVCVRKHFAIMRGKPQTRAQ